LSSGQGVHRVADLRGVLDAVPRCFAAVGEKKRTKRKDIFIYHFHIQFHIHFQFQC